MEKVELLAPAGDYEKLVTAIKYGADAVYIAGDSFGLRTASKNFSMDEIKRATDYAHKNGVKIYITMNIIPHNEDLNGVEDYVKELDKIGVDALIVSDPGMIARIRKVSSLPIDMSTQASVTNYDTINFWGDFGLRRVILARELSLDEVKEIRKHISDDMQLEMFVHGAMCISYSGRCLLSNYMTGRDANMGDCAHACRWKYALVEQKRPGEYFPIAEDDQGAYILNSKDLCLLPYIDKVIESGINSLKIEGRVKSQYYVATVVRAYRMAIDAYYNGEFNEKLVEELLAEIRKASHRDFTTGFAFGKADETSQIYDSVSYKRDYDFVGIVTDYNTKTQIATIEQRNKIVLGDKLEVFGPNKKHYEICVDKMYNEDDIEIEEAPHAQQIIKMKLPEAGEYYMIRKEK